MLGKNIIKIIAPALVAAAVAAPIAQGGPGASDPAGQTEAKGYLAIASYLATRNPSVQTANPVVTDDWFRSSATQRALVTTASAPLAVDDYFRSAGLTASARAADLAGRTEAKGYLGISNYLASQGSTEAAAGQPTSFQWGDAGIGAAFAAGLFLLGAVGGLFLRRRRVIAHLRH
jgi:hypothetical protein